MQSIAKMSVWMVMAAVLFVSNSAAADPVPAKIDKTSSSLTFTATNSLLSADGIFRDWSVEGKVDPEAFESSKVTVKIVAKSIDTDNSWRDDHLRNEDFFHVEKFPTVRFVTTSIQKTGEGKYTLVGDLTIKKTTRSLSIPVILTKEGGKMRIKGSTTINRVSHGLTFESGLLEPNLHKMVKIGMDVSFVLP